MSNNHSCGPSGNGTTNILIFTPKILTLDGKDGSVNLKIELWVSLDSAIIKTQMEQLSSRQEGKMILYCSTALERFTASHNLSVMQRNLPDPKIPIRFSVVQHFYWIWCISNNYKYDNGAVMYSPCSETTDWPPDPKYNWMLNHKSTFKSHWLNSFTILKMSIEMWHLFIHVKGAKDNESHFMHILICID